MTNRIKMKTIEMNADQVMATIWNIEEDLAAKFLDDYDDCEGMTAQEIADAFVKWFECDDTVTLTGEIIKAALDGTANAYDMAA